MSLDNLIEGIVRTNNPTVLGLDPNLDFIPDCIKRDVYGKLGKTFEGAAYAAYTFNRGLIDATYDIVPAIKPQCAYYEQLGWQGIKVLQMTISYAKQKGMFVIADGKRNDIGSTMTAYSNAYLGETDIDGEQMRAFEADALTVNGYLGSDGIMPALVNCQNKGIFVLVKTSNPSSGELQDKAIDSETVYEAMGNMCEVWGAKCMGKYGYSSVGAVVGATYPQQLAELRKKLPSTFFLVPGYGFQGGGAKDIAGAFDDRGIGAVINSSRAIMCAYKKDGYSDSEYKEAARDEAIRMRDDINAAIENRK